MTQLTLEDLKVGETYLSVYPAGVKHIIGGRFPFAVQQLDIQAKTAEVIFRYPVRKVGGEDTVRADELATLILEGGRWTHNGEKVQRLPIRVLRLEGDEMIAWNAAMSVREAFLNSELRQSLSHPTNAANGPWSEREVVATVADYFAMFRDELGLKPVNKTRHRKALVKLLSNRSPQAVEFKHCNISSVLRDMHLTYISGYKPRGNYQDLLARAVEKYLLAHPKLRSEILDLDAAAMDSPPDGSRFALADIEVAPPQPAKRGERPHIRPVRTDWGSVTAYSRELGEQGERFVLELERRRLRDAGRADLVPKVEWVSQTLGDGAGYDIKSFEADGKEIFIEVKTTNGAEGMAFYVTANELRCSEERRGSYRLYRVFQFKTNPRLYRLTGPLTSVLDLEAKVYSASCKLMSPK